MVINIGLWGTHKKDPDIYGKIGKFLERHSGWTLQDKGFIELKRRAQLAEETEHAEKEHGYTTISMDLILPNYILKNG